MPRSTDTDTPSETTSTQQPVPVSDKPMPTAEERAAAQESGARQAAVVFHYNPDGTFTPRSGELPPGAITPQDALNAWQAQSAGGVNGGTQWVDTFRLPANQEFGELLEGARAAGLYHWSDGTMSLIVMDMDTDIARLQDAFTRTVRGEGGIEASFDANGRPL